MRATLWGRIGYALWVLSVMAGTAVMADTVDKADMAGVSDPKVAPPAWDVAGLDLSGGATGPPRSERARAVAAPLREAMVRVEGDASEAYGFLVDKGLNITAAGVVEGFEHPVIRFVDGVRRVSKVLTVDREANIAVLQFDPSSLPDRAVLRPAAAPPVQDQMVVALAGEPVPGFIYRTEPRAILFDRDLKVDPDGIPVLNLAGEVVGLVCAPPPGVPSRRDIWGFRPMEPVERALAAARERLKAAPPEAQAPPVDALPAISAVPVPQSALHAASHSERQPLEIAGLNNLDAFILTPFIMVSTIGRPVDCGAMRDQIEGGGPFPYMGRMGLCLMDPVVTIEVVPVPRETARSKWLRRGIAILGSGYYPSPKDGAGPVAKTPPYSSKGFEPSFDDMSERTPEMLKERAFRDGVLDLQLVRGGKAVGPVRRIRFRLGGFEAKQLDSPGNVAFGGAYAFDPSAFEPSQPLLVRIRRAADPTKWHEIAVDPRMQQKVWDDFAPWRAASEKSS